MSEMEELKKQLSEFKDTALKAFDQIGEILEKARIEKVKQKEAEKQKIEVPPVEDGEQRNPNQNPRVA